MKNLILIGFMGAGKTSVGKLLAREKGMRFVDTDERISREQGMGIPDIFKAYGEDCFREMETKLLKRMNEDTQNTVISVGGGMPVREENRSLLRSLGLVVYLTASRETILGRVRGDHSRPLLSGTDLEERVDRLMREREHIYRQTAHLAVETDGRGLHQVTRIIGQESRRFAGKTFNI